MLASGMYQASTSSTHNVPPASNIMHGIMHGLCTETENGPFGRPVFFGNLCPPTPPPKKSQGTAHPSSAGMTRCTSSSSKRFTMRFRRLLVKCRSFANGLVTQFRCGVAACTGPTPIMLEGLHHISTWLPWSQSGRLSPSPH